MATCLKCMKNEARIGLFFCDDCLRIEKELHYQDIERECMEDHRREIAEYKKEINENNHQDNY